MELSEARKQLEKARENLRKSGTTLEEVLEAPGLTPEQRLVLAQSWIRNDLGPLKRQ